MKKIIIKTQEELDKLTRVEADEQVEIAAGLQLRSDLQVFGWAFDLRLDCSLEYRVVAWESSQVEARGSSRVEARERSQVVARGSSRVEAWGSSRVVAWESSQVEAWGSSQVEARESSQVEAWGSSQVVARGSSRVVARESSQVEAWGSSQVEARESSRVEARGSSQVVARGSSQVVAWGSSQVVAWGSSQVVAWESSQVEAWESSQVEAWGSSRVEARESSRVEAWGSSRVEAWGSSQVVAWMQCSVHIFSSTVKSILNGFAVAFASADLKCRVTVNDSALFRECPAQDWFDAHGIKRDETVILYKRVSSDFKTQESTVNETLWAIGSTVTHSDWRPKSSECGIGKFHACAKPYFCDEFRSTYGDKYVAIQVKLTDTHQWKQPSYPHKIAFREGVVLYQCDRFGERV